MALSYDSTIAYERQSDYEYRCMMRRQKVADEMYNLKHDALERISKVVHPEFELEFVKLLTSGLSEKLEDAEILAKKLGLSQAHIIAIEGDEDEMKRYLVNNYFEL